MAGIVQIYEGLAAWRATGAELLRPYFLALLAEAYSKAGQANGGLNILDEALATIQITGERWWEAEIHRLRGELLLRQAVGKGGSRTAPTATAMAIEVDSEEPGQSSRLVEEWRVFRGNVPDFARRRDYCPKNMPRAHRRVRRRLLIGHR